MILDTSALVAVLLNQPARARLLEILKRTERKLISAVTLYETGTVVTVRRGIAGVTELLALLAGIGTTVVPFLENDALRAVALYRQYGKGLHPAGLNLGDCAVCQLAEQYPLPVLATSDEFQRAGFSSILP